MSENIRRAAELWGRGKTGGEIGAALGLTRSAVSGIIARNRAMFPPRNLTGSRSAIAEAKRVLPPMMSKLWKEGLSAESIAEKLDITVDVAKRVVGAHPELFPKRSAQPRAAHHIVTRPRSTQRQERAAAELQARIEKILPHWPSGMRLVDIAEATGMTVDMVASTTRARRDLFPQRPKAHGAIMAQRARKVAEIAAVAESEPEEPARRPARAQAFLPLAGTRPQPLSQSCGCLWPVQHEATDPLTTPTELFCDAPRQIKGHSAGGKPILAPYCEAHAALSRGEAEWRASRERRAA